MHSTFAQTATIKIDVDRTIGYSKMYPTAAARIIETTKIFALPKNKRGMHTLTIRPLDPGVVFLKVIVDNGGYEETYRKMPESPYQKQ